MGDEDEGGNDDGACGKGAAMGWGRSRWRRGCLCVCVCVRVWAASLGEEGEEGGRGEGRVPTADRCLGMKIGGMAGPVR